MHYSKDDVTEAREQLKRLRRGDTVYTILRHVSRSGMMRRISVVTIQRNQPRCWDWTVSRLLGLPRTGVGITVTGCGMDMGFHLVYSLSAALFRGRRGIEKGREGYALEHRWL